MKNHIIKTRAISITFLMLISLNSFVFADYRKDADLEFLRYCDNADLGVLVNYLIYDEDGDKRLTETLTLNDEYRIIYRDEYSEYWELIAAELQMYGGNTFANIYRGDKGVSYREILIDVSDEFDVNYDSSMTTEEIEISLLGKILKDSLENMNDKEIKELEERHCFIRLKKLPSKSKLINAMHTCIKNSNFKYIMATVVAKSITKRLGRLGINITLTAVLTKVIGKIGLLVSSAMDVNSIAGPAYRVTVPSVIQVAYMRQKLAYMRQKKE